jgi:hypothetical protein
MPSLRTVLWLFVAIATILGPAQALRAKTLQVGPDRTLKTPSAAAAIAAAGDLIAIDPNEYYDCAVWKADRLTIIGMGPGVVITDTVCEGKALFITLGNDITIRNITFTRARVPDRNGAGIRVEGRNLTIDKSRFINNENGVLIGDITDSTLTIVDSEFTANGKCAPDCAHGIYAGHIALLRVERSKFLGTKQGHHIKSRAERTELIGNDIADGPDGTSSYLVHAPNGGSLIMDGNTLEKSTKTTNQDAAIMIGDAEPLRPGELRFVKNVFANDTGQHTAFVLNWTGTDARFADNVLRGDVTEESTKGAWVHQLRTSMSDLKSNLVESLKGLARRVRDR